MKALITQRHKEFEEEFPDGLYTIYHYGESGEFAQENDATKDLLSFHDQSVLMVLEKVREMAHSMEYDIEAENRVPNGELNRMEGHNMALAELADKLSSAISEIKGNER